MAGWSAFQGRRAVVTGASSGIGAGLARALAARGARVALVARREPRLAALAAEIGAGASVHPCDVGDPQAVRRCAAEIEEAGGVDVLVNAAGFVQHVLARDQAVEDVEALLRTNFLGAVWWACALLPGMRARRSGCIVNVSSFAALVPQPDEAAYAASKAALTTWSESIAHELAPEGIHVCTVHPTLVQTEMFTPAVMERMPKGSERRMISTEAFTAATLAALARGRTHVVIPRRMALAPLARALAPEWFARTVARVRLAALPASPADRER